MRTWVSAVLVVAAPGGRARADEITVSFPIDGAIAGAATLAYVLSETALKGTLAPAECRWCDTNVNSVDRFVRDELVLLDIDHPHRISNITAYMLTPAVAFVLLTGASSDEDRGRSWPTDALAVDEAAIVAACLNQIVKFAAGRHWPFVTFGIPYFLHRKKPGGPAIGIMPGGATLQVTW